MDIDQITLDTPILYDLESMQSPSLANAEVYNLKKSTYPMFAIYSKLSDEQRKHSTLAPGANPDSYVVVCPNCSMPMKIKGNLLVCTAGCPITFNMSIRYYMNQPIKGEYFFKENKLENQYFYFPLCEKCKKVSFGASTNKNYNSNLQAYWMCGCDRQLPSRITLNAPFDLSKLAEGSSVYKLATNMFSEHYFRIKPFEKANNPQVVGGSELISKRKKLNEIEAAAAKESASLDGQDF